MRGPSVCIPNLLQPTVKLRARNRNSHQYLKMKLSLSYLTLASAISLAAASSCTSDVAMAWPYTPEEDGSDDGPVGTNGSSTSCDDDVNCAAITAGIAAEGQCNALGLIDDSTCVKKLKLLKRSMKRTVNLDCDSNEGCYAFLDDSLLCMDPETGTMALFE